MSLPLHTPSASQESRVSPLTVFPSSQRDRVGYSGSLEMAPLFPTASREGNSPLTTTNHERYPRSPTGTSLLTAAQQANSPGRELPKAAFHGDSSPVPLPRSRPNILRVFPPEVLAIILSYDYSPLYLMDRSYDFRYIYRLIFGDTDIEDYLDTVDEDKEYNEKYCHGLREERSAKQSCEAEGHRCSLENYSPSTTEESKKWINAIINRFSEFRVKIVCGAYYTAIVSEDGALSMCGDNRYGQLGVDDKANRYGLQTSIPSTPSCKGFERNRVRKVACGEYHTMVLKMDGTLWACGMNIDGQLGLGDFTNRYVFTQVFIPSLSTANTSLIVKDIACGGSHSLVITKDDPHSTWREHTDRLCRSVCSLRCPFTSQSGGRSPSLCSGISSSQRAVGGPPTGYKQFWKAQPASRAVLSRTAEEGAPRSSTEGGQTQTPSASVQASYRPKGSSGRSLWACGSDRRGELGLGLDNGTKVFQEVLLGTPFPDPGHLVPIHDFAHPKQVACGYNHTVFLDTNGKIWATGSNYKGWLGLGSGQQEYRHFTQVPVSDVKKVVCSSYNTMIIKKDNSLWGCGKNDLNQLGLIDGGSRTEFTRLPIHPSVPRRPDMGQLSPHLGEAEVLTSTVDLGGEGGTTTSISPNFMGRYAEQPAPHLDEAEVPKAALQSEVSRLNEASQSGLVRDNVKRVACKGEFTVVLKRDITPVEWGSSAGEGRTVSEEVQSQALCDKGTCPLSGELSVWGCGSNNFQQLGSLKEIVHTFTRIPIDSVEEIACGNVHTVLLRRDTSRYLPSGKRISGGLFLWGSGANSYGQLGLGDDKLRKSFTRGTAISEF